ncbi:hypothetical protein DFI02_1133 [Rhizobium sp. PP-F2F-G20b]|nr:hypothetical protein DFI02_1133 [Rhizobium sp. PP-F2F-G20b]
MKKYLIIVLTTLATLTSLAPVAEARQGCGKGFHRGPAGYCRANRGPRPPVVIIPAGPRVGIFCEGRGYWDGHRYWRHRARHHSGWRYY